MSDLQHAPWHKSSRSGAGNACVEVATLANGDRAIRDSKNPSGPVLKFAASQWAALTAEICAGQLD